MSESRQKYDVGRKKTIVLPGKVTADVPLSQFSDEFRAWLQSKGYNYQGPIEVAYEEEPD